MTIRTRIAPSPTGAPHLGTAYIALFNRAFAKQNGGEFILRIEDSDAERSSAQSEREIIEALQWLGLDWDEGPGIGGPCGSYRISERLDIYVEHARILQEKGGAFTCFCTRERLDEVRKSQQQNGETPRYDGHCLSLTPAEVARRKEAGEPHVIRLKVPDQGDCTFVDQIRGDISIPWRQVDMQVLVKSDGYPTYHLCATVDDHLMGVTHILRGEEWLSSCPKHVLLYDYFGWDFQQLYHLPLLRNADQSKMSKRKNPTGINYYRSRGYLPEALLNYLATMGWSMPDEREKFTKDEFTANLDLNRISPRGPIFDLEKLDWLNGLYIREMSDTQFQDTFNDWARHRFEGSLKLVKQRTERFDQVIPQVVYLLGDRPELTIDSLTDKRHTSEDVVKILNFASRAIEELEDWSSELINDQLRQTSERCNLSMREFLAPLFVAISGRRVALPLFDSIELLGLEETRVRLRGAIEVLGGLSKKKLKRLDSEWDALSG